MPLAPVAQLPEARLPAVLRQVHDRLHRELPPTEAGKLWGATGVLLGLQYPLDFIEQLVRGVETMEESSVYQGLLARGELRGLRTALLTIGGDHMGEPDAATRQLVESIADVTRLTQLIAHAREVDSWEELLATPSQTQTQHRRRRSGR